MTSTEDEGDDETSLDARAGPVHRWLTGFFRRKVHNNADVEDMVQDVFLRIAARDSTDTIEHLDGYVLKTASNVLTDRMRQRSTRRTDFHLAFDPDLHGEVEFDPARILSGKEDLNAAITALLCLPERTRVVFLLKRLEGCKVRDIAAHLGLSISAVEKHLVRAVRHLHAEMENILVREALTFEGIRGLPADEAAALFVARRSEGLTPSEQDLLTRWLGTDDANQRALDGADRAWNWIDGGADDEILTAMRAHARAPRSRPRASLGWERLAAAAVIVIVVGAGVMFATGLIPKASGPGGQAVVPSTGTLYASAIGEVKTITLPDGSRMTLDADSAAVGRFDPAGRSIELKRGRAFFAVVHNAARPFTVLAANRRLVDVGTRFDVNLGPKQLTVTLLDGRLAVGPAGQTTVTATLKPGQQLVSQDDTDQIVDVGDAAEDAAAWRTGLIRFDDQSLAEAAAVMNRYSHEQIVIGSADVGAIRVSGQFRAGHPEAFAETLTELYNLKSRREANQIELLPGG